MYQREYTELAKAAYLACCGGCKWVTTKAPKNINSKATFVIQAPYEKFLDVLEMKWDKPNKAGKPMLPDARKYFFKIKQMRDKAISLYRAYQKQQTSD